MQKEKRISTAMGSLANKRQCGNECQSNATRNYHETYVYEYCETDWNYMSMIEYVRMYDSDWLWMIWDGAGNRTFTEWRQVSSLQT